MNWTWHACDSYDDAIIKPEYDKMNLTEIDVNDLNHIRYSVIGSSGIVSLSNTIDCMAVHVIWGTNADNVPHDIRVCKHAGLSSTENCFILVGV